MNKKFEGMITFNELNTLSRYLLTGIQTKLNGIIEDCNDIEDIKPMLVNLEKDIGDIYSVLFWSKQEES